MTPEELSELIGLLYDMATNDTMWPQLLDRLRRAFNGDMIQFAVMNVDTFEIPESRSENASPGMDEEFKQYVSSDPLQPKAFALEGVPLQCSGLLGPDERRLNPFYNEFMRRYGLEWRLGCNVSYSGDYRAALGVVRADRRGAFDVGDSRVLELIIPHLRRALTIRARSSQLQITRETALSTLSLVPSALILLDQSGQVIFANLAAEQMVRRDRGVHISRGRLHFTDAEANRKLQFHIRSARPKVALPSMPPGGLFSVRGPLDSRLSVLVAPVSRPQALSIADAPTVVVMIHDRTTHGPGMINALRSLYGLTRAEARVLEGLLAGYGLAELADLWGLSRDTLKSQLAQVFAKTGTSRQADLLRQVQGNLVAAAAANGFAAGR